MQRRSFIGKARDNLMMLYYCRCRNGLVPERYNYATTIEVTSTCNLSCPLCPVARGQAIISRRSQFITFERFKRIVEKTSAFTNTYVLSMWGEPLLHREFFDFLDHLKGKTIYFASNLNYAEKVAERLSAYDVNIHCSIDSTQAEKYLTYRVGGNYDLVLRNLKILLRGACTVHPTFFDDEENGLALCRELGIDERRAIMIRKFDTRDNTSLLEKRETTFRCDSLHRGLYFTSDGDLTACCLSHQPDLIFGNIDDFQEGDLLNDRRIVAMRNRIFSDKNQFASCRFCNNATLTDVIQKKARAFVTRGTTP